MQITASRCPAHTFHEPIRMRHRCGLKADPQAHHIQPLRRGLPTHDSRPTCTSSGVPPHQPTSPAVHKPGRRRGSPSANDVTEFGEWRHGELGGECCASIQHLVHRLALLATASLVGLVHVDANADDPDPAFDVFVRAQKPSALHLPFQHTPPRTQWPAPPGNLFKAHSTTIGPGPR